MSRLFAKTRQLAVVCALAVVAAGCGGSSTPAEAESVSAVGPVAVATTAPIAADQPTSGSEVVATDTAAVDDGSGDAELSTEPAAPIEEASESSASTAVPPTTEPAPIATAEPVAPAILVPELTGQFTTISGGQIDLGSLQGQDVVLWFWAPW